MNDQDLTGKKVFSREKQLGKLNTVKRIDNKKVAIVEVSNNSFKAIPFDQIREVANRLEYNGNYNIIEGIPELSSRDVENDDDKIRHSLIEHFGEPEHWHKSKRHLEADKDNNAYMGSSQITEQEPEHNKSMKDEVDYDKIKHGDKKQ